MGICPPPPPLAAADNKRALSAVTSRSPASIKGAGRRTARRRQTWRRDRASGDMTDAKPARAQPLPLLALLPLLLLALLARRAACQHYFLLRPVPSDSLPLVELREDPDPALDPRERDLNETELRALLGDFDARFLALSPPAAPAAPVSLSEAGSEPPEDDEARQRFGPGGTLPKEIRALDLDAQLPGRRHKKLKRRLQHWLWAYSFCPLLHSWSDLGARFWPRYVRAGSCPAKRSCSLPEGMTCRPAASAHLTLLRWRCAHRKAGLKCAWIPVRHPVITDCKCACAA